jgi:predicted GIY-YIG superfamily endonuclease
MTTNIYILRLENDKWYVGKSHNPAKRYTSHMNGTGSVWTLKYKPLELFKVIENVSPFQEDAVTKEYMSDYGIDNVRGGSYVTLELSPQQKESIQKEIWSMRNLCNQCGSAEHWVNKCNRRTVCKKCGRNTHNIEKCYAKKHLNGSPLINEIIVEHFIKPPPEPDIKPTIEPAVIEILKPVYVPNIEKVSEIIITEKVSRRSLFSRIKNYLFSKDK